jgi:tetratricopeptide (TPR) repeat protein
LNSFLPSYHDPVFSIILIVLIAIAIALVTHAWGVYRKEKLRKSLYSFLDKFDSTTCSLEEEEVPFEEGMAKPLLLLAKAFEQSGNYAKTISICLYLIRHTRDDELLIYLGKVYLRAGFYQRAEEIFLEIIRRRPRRSDVLYQLEYLYESLHSFGKAREALDALRALGEETEPIEAHLRFLEIRGEKSLRPAEKAKRLKELLREAPRLYRPVLQELFRLDTAAAWEEVRSEKIPELIDILWYLPPAQLQLDIIAREPALRAIYYARGDLEDAPEEETGDFAVDMLCAAREGGYFGGTMSFAYLCGACKQSFPVSFVRCPGCLALDSLNVEEHLVPSQPQIGDSLL